MTEVWRDKRIAHFDRDTVVGPNPLPTITRSEIAAAIKTAFEMWVLAESAVRTTINEFSLGVDCPVALGGGRGSAVAWPEAEMRTCE